MSSRSCTAKVTPLVILCIYICNHVTTMQLNQQSGGCSLVGCPDPTQLPPSSHKEKGAGVTVPNSWAWSGQQSHIAAFIGLNAEARTSNFNSTTQSDITRKMLNHPGASLSEQQIAFEMPTDMQLFVQADYYGCYMGMG